MATLRLGCRAAAARSPTTAIASACARPTIPLTLLRNPLTRCYATGVEFETKPRLHNPHPTPRPTNIAYFTGNPRYYNSLMQINALMRKYNISPQEPLTASKQRPRWMTIKEMQEFLSFKITQGTYDEFVKKLNQLYDKHGYGSGAQLDVKKALESFVKPGATLTVSTKRSSELDDFGRSYSYGSRKTAKAQVWVVEGEGQLFVNGTNFAEYFAEDTDRDAILRPLVMAHALGKYNVWALVNGGGQSGQAAAVAVGLARGLAVHDPVLKETFDEAGLTRIDTRQVERKKTGQPKARKKNTWVKR
ncbi:ribosomal protein S9/S16-domain-containing protein [Fimicolochytrium jonesii]|uniref:ribosomal protein S9/S16-domain-containing protein n=1 Tax=Fimicolochytrium jonesii TaxID=1396493 RepID=UPI0022FDC24B|nr:ribosomal protein S9/S16-domain-containing protein [Fimicolochytrium jonesii]KAI8818010.1 ribosomal protein S9/S16-domain-containing protein [Fimicolochytrium jonesii]